MEARIAAVANQKGGVGKTTTAINLAAGLTALGKKVLLVDLDPQANATSGLGVEATPGRSLYRALLGLEPAGTFIQPTAYRRLDLIPSELDLAGCEVEIARSEHYLHRLKDCLESASWRQRYDIILLDCPPSLGLITMNALTAAQGLLIPMQCEYYALEGLSVMMKLIDALRQSGDNRGLHVDGVIMTMYDGRTNLARQVVAEVRRHFGDLVFDTLIPRTIRLGEAPSFGKPVLVHDPHGVGSEAYLALARECAARLDALQEPDATKTAPTA